MPAFSREQDFRINTKWEVVVSGKGWNVEAQDSLQPLGEHEYRYGEQNYDPEFPAQYVDVMPGVSFTGRLQFRSAMNMVIVMHLVWSILPCPKCSIRPPSSHPSDISRFIRS